MISIAYVLELVAAVAVGLGMYRYAETVGMPFDLTTGLGLSRAWIYVSAGIALVGLVGLVVEVARRRAPERWGLGRWTWAVVGVSIVAVHLVGMVKGVREGMFYLGFPWIYFYGIQPAWSYLGLALVSVWIATRMARLPRDPKPDAREWAGRVYGGLVTVTSVIYLVT
jgi:hypothetical protein